MPFDLAEAVKALCCELAPIDGRECVGLRAAWGRVLAASLVARADVPAFDNAAMDGYAVRAADCSARSTELRLVGTALAGHGYDGRVETGEAVRITTGAPLPAGADAVVMQEDVTHDSGRIRFATPVRSGLHVRPRGEQIRAGEQLIAAGTVLDAPQIALAAVAGAADVEVFRRLRVGLASTGDELFDPPAPLFASGSYDANRPLLEAACRAAGFDVFDFGLCADRADDFAALLARAGELGVDALVVSGGSALGDADVVRKAQSVRFVPFDIRPGRGITLAHVPSTAGGFTLLGLPGNAVAAFVMFHLVALPALRQRAGAEASVPAHVALPLACDLEAQPGLVDYRRGRFERAPSGELVVRPLEQQGSGMVRTLAEADVLIAAGPAPHHAAGDVVPVIVLSALPH